MTLSGGLVGRKTAVDWPLRGSGADAPGGALRAIDWSAHPLAFLLPFLRRDPFIEKEAPEIPRRPKRPLVIFALLYSIEFFIPVVTVTGVENWGWVIAPNYRWAELTERLMGLVLTSLAAFSLSEYFF
jgi:hypothetical protein